jgi:AcrR family transcriptional regulator
MGRTGRRPGTSATRERILEASRASFGARGLDGASIREVAAQAGVDPALVHHYFGSKQRLFVAAMAWPFDPADVIPAIARGDPDRLGERLARFVIGLLEDPAIQPIAIGLLRSAATDPVAAGMLRELVETGPIAALSTLAPQAGDIRLRASLVGSQVIGLAMARYVVGVEPIASADPEVLVRALAPTFQRYLSHAVSGDGR